MFKKRFGPASIPLLLLGILFIAACTPNSRVNRNLQDGKAPTKIVSLTLMTDELLLLLGAEDQTLALSTLADQRGISNVVEEAKLITLRAPTHPEAISNLNPDLVLLADWSSLDLIQSLEALGIKTLILPTPRTLDEIIQNVLYLGKVLGKSDTTQRLVNSLQEVQRVLETFRNSLSVSDKRTILEYDPMGTSGGPQTLWGDMVRNAGLINKVELADVGTWGFAPISREALLRLDPWFLCLPDWSFDPQYPAEMQLKALQNDVALAQLGALKENRILYIPESLRSAASPFMMKGIIVLVQQAYPKQWSKFLSHQSQRVREVLDPWLP